MLESSPLSVSLLPLSLVKQVMYLSLQDGDDEYSLLVNLKRLYELQLSRAVTVGSLYEDFVRILRSLRSGNAEVS